MIIFHISLNGIARGENGYISLLGCDSNLCLIGITATNIQAAVNSDPMIAPQCDPFLPGDRKVHITTTHQLVWSSPTGCYHIDNSLP